MAGIGLARSQDAWQMPLRIPRPELATEEGGLWAIMDREERNLRRSPFLIRDRALHDYVQDIACRLAGDHCPDVRVHIVNTPLFNASMAPNGMMQVWSGCYCVWRTKPSLPQCWGMKLVIILKSTREFTIRSRRLFPNKSIAVFVPSRCWPLLNCQHLLSKGKFLAATIVPP